ncbi:MAG: radical SAM family heme chaperone HemW [Lachnospiraceae bacterium]|nr:radical SAM family heme chaperone HemW [Lachnospiraceae bacterium]
MKNKFKPLSVYLHIPFCRKKCNYCDFLSAPADDETIRAYADALSVEIAAKGEEIGEGYFVKTIFIGGGTPNILPAHSIGGLLDNIRSSFNVDASAEITMEMNPGIYDFGDNGKGRDELALLKAKGINRLSIGLQTNLDDKLKTLGRIHDHKAFETMYAQAEKAGFENINIDMISSLPGQTFEEFKEDLKRTVSFGSKHISAYSLIIEEETAFGRMKRDELDLPDEEEEYRIYCYTREFLEQNGYKRYEISNYAREGYECRHNITYWKSGEYLGLGLGSSGLLNEIRYTVTEDLKAYIANPVNNYRECTDLTEKDRMEEYMFLGLRMTEGISLKHFEECFGISAWEIYEKPLNTYISEGFLEKEGDRLRLTEAGLDVSNEILSHFLLDIV